MKIKYLGHSSFLITGKDKSVVTDPFGDIGYEIERVSADFCTVSHGHFDHNAVEKVNARKIITSSSDGFLAIETYHDPYLGAKRGKNTAFKFSVDGVTFCHLGDVGEYFSDSLAEEIGEVDVLFIPVGGNYTINYAEAVRYVEGIKPKIVIPMHYKTSKSNIDIDSAEPFLKRMAGVERTGREIALSLSDTEGPRTVYVMDNGEL